MRRLFLIGVAMLSLMLVLIPACKASVTAAPGQEFQLKVGQTASISGEDLTLKFVRVSEDSRCPTGVT